MIVRELVASFGIDVDKGGVKEADNAIKGLVESAKDLGIAFGFQQIFAGMQGMVNAASEVNEALNVINQSFGEGTDEVLAWAKESGEAMGRSEFQMREMAASFGAILSPMLGPKQAAQFSKTLSDLSVDLGSFFNMADEEASQRLLSGLMGETESVRKLGVNLSADALQAFGKTEGITKAFNKMSEAEKVALRFKKILVDTKNAQGDAARTGDGYANQVKRLEGNLHTLQVTVGQKLIDSFNKLVGVGGSVVEFFMVLTKDTRMLEIALGALGFAFVIFAGKVLLANLPIVIMTALIIGLIAVIDDMFNAFDGKPSVIADFWKAVVGETQWDNIKQTWIDSMSAIGDLVFDWMNDQEGAWDRFYDRIAGKGGQHLKDAALALIPGANELRAARDQMMVETEGDESGFTMKALDFLGIPHRPKGTGVEPVAPGSQQTITTPWVPGVSPYREIPAAGGRGPLVRVQGGDINVTLHGNVSPAAVREAGQTAEQLQQKQARDLANSAGVKPGG